MGPRRLRIVRPRPRSCRRPRGSCRRPRGRWRP